MIDKEKLIFWLKENNYRKMTAEEIIYEIEQGYFDKELTP